MNNPYYVIQFDDVYLDTQSQSGQTIHGRRMLLALIPTNQSQSYEYTYQLAGGRSEWAFIFDDIIIQQIISQINIYGKGDSKRLADILESYSEEYWNAHVGTVGVSHAWLPLVADSFGPYVSLDPNYSTPSSKKSNKVLRTLATGQSDITRHEAYTKATGLNEFNSLTPLYEGNTKHPVKLSVFCRNYSFGVGGEYKTRLVPVDENGNAIVEYAAWNGYSQKFNNGYFPYSGFVATIDDIDYAVMAPYKGKALDPETYDVNDVDMYLAMPNPGLTFYLHDFLDPKILGGWDVLCFNNPHGSENFTWAIKERISKLQFLQLPKIEFGEFIQAIQQNGIEYVPSILTRDLDINNLPSTIYVLGHHTYYANRYNDYTQFFSGFLVEYEDGTKKAFADIYKSGEWLSLQSLPESYYDTSSWTYYHWMDGAVEYSSAGSYSNEPPSINNAGAWEEGCFLDPLPDPEDLVWDVDNESNISVQQYTQIDTITGNLFYDFVNWGVPVIDLSNSNIK